MAGTKVVKYPSDVGYRAVSGSWVIVLTLVLGAEALLLLVLLISMWPGSYPSSQTTAPITTVSFLGSQYQIDRDRSLLIMVALAGATGAMGHVLRSFFRYAGERKLMWSWVPQYILIPFLGALMATVTYVVVRAGFIGISDAGLGNPFGFAAIALLVGLFSAQAVQKLKLIFEQVFTNNEQGADSVEADVAKEADGGGEKTGDKLIAQSTEIGAADEADGETDGAVVSAETSVAIVAPELPTNGSTPQPVAGDVAAAPADDPTEADAAAIDDVDVTADDDAPADADADGVPDDGDDEADAAAYETEFQAEGEDEAGETPPVAEAPGVETPPAAAVAAEPIAPEPGQGG